jgi:hypothetical protein
MATISREFITTKIQAIWPNADVSVGSRVDAIIVKPLLNLFADYSTEDFEAFLTARMEEFNPSLVTAKGSANYDILVGPLRAILEPLEWEINALKTYQSLDNYTSMPDEEVDSLVANYFLSRNPGSYASGSVRVYFSSPVGFSVSKFVKFKNNDGLGFVPTSVQVFQADAMSFNQEGNLYYVDIPVIAEGTGTEYNISAKTIVSVENLNASYVKVANLLAFNGGTSKETSDDLYTRAKDSITVRNLISKKSIRSVLLGEFNNIENIEVIGFGDIEMERDLITTGYSTTTTITNILSGSILIPVGSSVVTGALQVHAGGKSDVYVYSTNLAEGYVDIGYLDSSVSIDMNSLPPYSINMPLIRVKDVERLDPISMSATGQYIPYAHPVDVRVLRDFYTDKDPNFVDRSVGMLRLFFDRPTSFGVDSTNTTFTTEDGLVFRPISTQSIPASGMSLNTGQNITSTEMDTNIVYSDNIKYYYFDISVVSDISGSTYTQLAQNTYLAPANYTSEGWTLGTTSTSLAFSTRETVNLTFSTTFNDGIVVTGEAIRIIYEWAPTIKDIQDYVEDDENRVVTTDILVKHFQPAYVDMAISYSGPINSEDVEVYVRNFINSIEQGADFEIADLINTLYSYGATKVSLPIEVLVIILQKDRTIESHRFEDSYKTEKRIHFVTRNLSITQTSTI